MNNRVVEHKIKLEKSVKIILGVLAVGVLLNAFAPVLEIRKANAQQSHNEATYGVTKVALCNEFGSVCADVMRYDLGVPNNAIGAR